MTVVTRAPGRPMRDVLIETIYERMASDRDIFFLSADMGAPALDALREDYPDRFINVGIAEQNLVNVAAGLAMEGFTVYTYAIAPFYLRAYEQIRINLSLPSQLRPMNVNMLGLGAGISYDVSGPTHHCLEDVSAMRALPNVVTVSPGDWTTAKAIADYAPTVAKPKYLRLDGKVLPTLYEDSRDIDFAKGFSVLKEGDQVCLVATGVTVHRALEAAEKVVPGAVGVVDAFLLDALDEAELAGVLGRYPRIITLEEAFVARGGLDMLVASALSESGFKPDLVRLGMPNTFDFTPGDRYALHEANGFGEEHILHAVESALA